MENLKAVLFPPRVIWLVIMFWPLCEVPGASISPPPISLFLFISSADPEAGFPVKRIYPSLDVIVNFLACDWSKIAVGFCCCSTSQHLPKTLLTVATRNTFSPWFPNLLDMKKNSCEGVPSLRYSLGLCKHEAGGAATEVSSFWKKSRTHWAAENYSCR